MEAAGEPVTVSAPGGGNSELTLEKAGEGIWRSTIDVKEPGLYKIISEGTLQAPRGFRAHLEMQSASFRRGLEYERLMGNLLIDDPDAIDIFAQMLISTREYLAGRFCYTDGEFVKPSPNILDTYEKLLRGKIFK